MARQPPLHFEHARLWPEAVAASSCQPRTHPTTPTRYPTQFLPPPSPSPTPHHRARCPEHLCNSVCSFVPRTAALGAQIGGRAKLVRLASIGARRAATADADLE